MGVTGGRGVLPIPSGPPPAPEEGMSSGDPGPDGDTYGEPLRPADEDALGEEGDAGKSRDGIGAKAEESASRRGV